MKKKKKERERERQEVLWPDTNARIATVNIHTKTLHCQSQLRLTKFLHSLCPVFDIAIITR